MFHRRQASLKKLAAKQTRPVQPVAPRPEALTKSPSPSPGTPFLSGSQVLLPCTLPALPGLVHGQQPACSSGLILSPILMSFMRTRTHSATGRQLWLLLCLGHSRVGSFQLNSGDPQNTDRAIRKSLQVTSSDPFPPIYPLSVPLPELCPWISSDLFPNPPGCH